MKRSSPLRSIHGVPFGHKNYETNFKVIYNSKSKIITLTKLKASLIVISTYINTTN